MSTVKAFRKWIGTYRQARLEAQCRVLQEALTKIASWREGEEVTVGFDEPVSAQAARAALAQFFTGPCPHGRDPYDRCDEPECESAPIEVVMARRIAMDAKKEEP